MGDIEDTSNEEEVDVVTADKRMLDMIPDILTSLGFGHLVGLVWGLRNFNPSDYTAMTSSCGIFGGRY